MSYYNYLFVSPLLEEEGKLNKKTDTEEHTLNPFYHIGRLAGNYILKPIQKGLKKGYGGVQHARVLGYDPHDTINYRESADCLFGCENIGNSLYKNDINGTNFSKFDRKASNSLFRNGPGENWGKVNEPALRAARTVNSYPHPMSAGTGINEGMEPFSLKNYRKY